MASDLVGDDTSQVEWEKQAATSGRQAADLSRLGSLRVGARYINGSQVDQSSRAINDDDATREYPSVTRARVEAAVTRVIGAR